VTSQPAVLLVTSAGSPAGGVTPTLAALEAAGLQVRAIDVGRAGSRPEGALDKMLQALAGEVAERRLLRELGDNPPDVTVTFDPATAAALSVVRDEGTHAAPVVAVIAELEPDASWAATDADRYLTVDEEAAVMLAEHGVDGERIIPVGPLCEWAFVEAAKESRDSLRQRYRIDAGPVVVVHVDGFGQEGSAQIALQLSLVADNATYLFDAGGDVEAATALRRQVPTLDLRAKLFGRTPDSARYWRCADVIVARPTPAAVARTMALGGRMVSFMPEGREAAHLARAMEARGLGTTAESALLLSSALEPLLGKPPRSDERVGMDGAGTVADVAWIVGSERREVIGERRAWATATTRARVEAAASAAEAAAQASAAAGGLEDLDGSSRAGSAPPPPDAGEISALRAEVRGRLAQAGKTVSQARAAADRLHEQMQAARTRGDDAAARDAERQADAERQRMHAALAEMAELQSELDRLEKATASMPKTPRAATASSAGGRAGTPGTSGRAGTGAGGAGRTGAARPSAAPPRQSLDDALDQMKRQQGKSAGGDQRTIDDELAALKRKMEQKKKKP
jgi:hypothetical protein